MIIISAWLGTETGSVNCKVQLIRATSKVNSFLAISPLRRSWA